jgi:hypothetical protein
MTQYEIFIQNENKQSIAQLESFSSFSCIRRFNLAGTWVIAGSTDSLAGLTKKMGILVRRNGQDFFSGVVSEFEDKSGLEMSVNGFSDEDLLVGALAYPIPSGAPYTVDYDVRSGVAETVMKQFVNLNVGPGAIPSRKIPGLLIETDSGRGTTVTGRARFDILLDLLNSLATQGKVGYRVLNSEFQVYKPQDKSGWIVFSKELGTLGSYVYKEKRGKANYVIAGGSGTGSSRTFIEVANSQSVIGWGRREKFIDKSNTSSAAELVAAATEEIETNGDEVSLTFQPLETSAMRPIDDYDVGDFVSGVIREETIIQQVREIKTTLSSTGEEQNELAIGTEGATTDLSSLARVYERMRNLDQRVNSMERR